MLNYYNWLLYNEIYPNCPPSTMLDCLAFSVTLRCIHMPFNYHLLIWIPREVPSFPSLWLFSHPDVQILFRVTQSYWLSTPGPLPSCKPHRGARDETDLGLLHGDN